MLINSLIMGSMLLLVMLESYGQQNPLHIGTAITLHHEIRSRMIYGPGRVERTSTTSFVGKGIRLEKRISPGWEVTTGAAYVKRHYEMTVPFSLCSFLAPGEGCPYILATVSEYGHKTVELPFGINRYLLERNKVEFYMNLSALVAVEFQSYYQSSTPDVGVKRLNKTQVFSNSILGGMGGSYRLTENLKLTLEPFIRLIHTQRHDPILITGYEKRRTKFDNYGGRLFLMFRI